MGGHEEVLAQLREHSPVHAQNLVGDDAVLDEGAIPQTLFLEDALQDGR